MPVALGTNVLKFTYMARFNLNMLPFVNDEICMVSLWCRPFLPPRFELVPPIVAGYSLAEVHAAIAWAAATGTLSGMIRGRHCCPPP